MLLTQEQCGVPNESAGDNATIQRTRADHGVRKRLVDKFDVRVGEDARIAPCSVTGTVLTPSKVGLILQLLCCTSPKILWARLALQA